MFFPPFPPPAYLGLHEICPIMLTLFKSYALTRLLVFRIKAKCFDAVDLVAFNLMMCT
jgi:hypothetical protein